VIGSARRTLQRARKGELSPQEVNNLAQAGQLTKTMFARNPGIQAALTPVTHTIDQAVQNHRTAENRAWSISQQAARQGGSFNHPSQTNTPGSSPPQDRPSGMPSQALFNGAMLNPSNPGSAPASMPAGFDGFSNQAFKTTNDMLASAEGRGVAPFEGLPNGVSPEMFAAAIGYQTGLTPIGSLGQTGMTGQTANHIMHQVQQTGEGGAASIATAVQQTANSIRDRMEQDGLSNPQAVVDHFNERLNNILGVEYERMNQ